MAPPLIPCVWTGKAFEPLQRAHNVLAAHYGAGEVLTLVEYEDRSEVSHRHEFAWLREAWASLPDSLAAEYPTAEHLRKRALINTGWCHVRDYSCASRAEAGRLAATLRGELDDYTVVIVRDAVVRVCRAKSQAKNKMKADDFQKSKTAVIEYVATLLEVAPADLAKQREPA